MSDEHQIITITDKEAVVENIGTIVSGDTNSCLLTFEINRFQDGIDLSDKKIRFNYRNSNGKFYDIAVNVKYSDDVIRFSWLLPYSLTQPGGNVIASIEFYGFIEYDEHYSYKTKNFKLSVEKSLGVDDGSDESYNNWTIRIENDVEVIQKKISEIEKEIKSIHVPTKLSEMDDDTEHRTVSDSQIDKWNEVHKNSQADWNEENTNSSAYIKNKPQITNDLTDELKSSYDEAVDKKHTHSNMSVLDGITYENIESWNNKSEFDGNYSSLQGIPDDIATETYVDEKVKDKVNDSDLAAVAKTGSYNDLNDIPASFPASDVYQWAKQPEKPTYTADEVGALPDTTQIPSIDDVNENTRVRHEHSNKTILDNIDDQYIKKWNSAYSHSISSHAPENAQENIIEDIKINGVSTAISDKTVNITTPTKTSDITNDSGFVTNITNELVNYYLKSEVYTKEEVQSLIGRISSLELIKVDALPTENIKTSAIYLVPSDQIEENNIYTEYIYMDGKWEIIGDTSVDLSQYALNKDVTELKGDISQLSKEIESVSNSSVSAAESKVSEHNVSNTSHNDIRLLIDGLTTRLNALADSDDTTLDQMSEVVAYIKSNKSLIDAITTSKINVSDIIDNLTTNVSNKPLSSAQGVALKALIDGITIPEKLPNPQKLIFSGAVTAEYDGSGSVTVTIPEGSGGSGGTVRIENGSTDTTVELEPNKLYVFPEMAELTITLTEPSDTGIANEYHFVFQSGSMATTLTIPDTVKIPSGYTVDANKIYEISILEGCLCAQNWEVSA